MSQEWLKKLAELSNDKDLLKRAQQMQKANEARKAARPASAATVGRRRSLLGAVFGSFFRWLFLFGLAEAAVMFVVAQSEGFANEPWGYILHYLAWYALTQPAFPPEAYAVLNDWFGLLEPDLAAFYDEINPFLQQQQEALVFYVPAAAALAVTLFFLPAINAGRRRSPLRVLVLMANLAVIVFFRQLGDGAIALWLGAFVFSFVGGSVRAQRPPQPQAPAAPQQARPAQQPQKAARAAPAMAAAAPSSVERAARSATVLTKREPTVVRRGERSWVRAR